MPRKLNTGTIGAKYSMLTLVNFEYYKNGTEYWNCKCECGLYKIIQLNTLIKKQKSCGCQKYKKKDINLVGVKFGKLVVTAFSHNILSRNYWNCLCLCGKVTVLSTGQLSSKRTSSCGCNRNISRFVDKSGQKFNMLTILNHEYIKNGKSYSKVKCDCGVEKIIATIDVSSGHTKSCNCLNNINKKVRKDIISQKFGKLTIIRYTRDTNNKLKCIYKCDCGNIKESYKNAILRGTVTSCGCRSRGSQTHGAIYGIYDKEGILKYIGQTVKYDLEKRLNAHITKPSGKMKAWIESLNYRPTIKPLFENVPIMELITKEKKVIKEHRKKYSLLNTTHNNI